MADSCYAISKYAKGVKYEQSFDSIVRGEKGPYKGVCKAFEEDYKRCLKELEPMGKEAISGFKKEVTRRLADMRSKKCICLL